MIPVIYPAEGTGWFVASRSTPGVFYLCDLDGACSCPATGRCWHREAVLEHIVHLAVTP